MVVLLESGGTVEDPYAFVITAVSGGPISRGSGKLPSVQDLISLSTRTTMMGSLRNGQAPPHEWERSCRKTLNVVQALDPRQADVRIPHVNDDWKQ